MENKRNLGIGGLVLIAGMSVLGLNEHLSTREIMQDLKYQGYRNEKSEGEQYLVFDENTLYNREGPAELVISGNPNGLEIGQRYDVGVKTPRWIGSKRATSYEPSDN